MAHGEEDLTGVWNGAYSYGPGAEESFVAVLIDHGARFSGTIHETPRLMGGGTPLSALVEGSRAHRRVSFVKTYDGTGGWSHSVRYTGLLSADATEIAGSWRVQIGSGTFLMVRAKSTEAEAEPRLEEPIGRS